MAIIQSGLEAIEMRNKMESKEALTAKGSLYVGTGGRTTVTKSGNSTVQIPVTTAFNPPNMDGGVMIRDISEDNDTGWKVEKIKTENLEDGRVEQANRANQADTILSNDEYKSFADAFVQTCLLKIYPVGSIYMSANNVSPQTFLGGTWVAWGAGRVAVGVDSSDSDFDTVEKTGGAKSVVLTKYNLPQHDHATMSEELSHSYIGAGLAGSVSAPVSFSTSAQSRKYLVTGASHEVDNPDITSAYRCRTGNAGISEAHNNLQPYITCYMWKRTA